MSLKTITFKTNHTILGEVTEKGDKVIVEKPVQVIVQPGQDGKAMVGFAPFLEYTEEFGSGIEFDRSDILSINTPVRPMLNQYNSMFGSGIQLVTDLPGR